MTQKMPTREKDYLTRQDELLTALRACNEHRTAIVAFTCAYGNCGKPISGAGTCWILAPTAALHEHVCSIEHGALRYEERRQ